MNRDYVVGMPGFVNNAEESHELSFSADRADGGTDDRPSDRVNGRVNGRVDWRNGQAGGA